MQKFLLANAFVLGVFFLCPTQAFGQTHCNDGTVSYSTGSGTCSSHGGITSVGSGSGLSLHDSMTALVISGALLGLMWNIAGSLTVPDGEGYFIAALFGTAMQYISACVEFDSDPEFAIAALTGGFISMVWSFFGLALDGRSATTVQGVSFIPNGIQF